MSLAVISLADAAERTWIGPNALDPSGSWSDPANWDPAGVPAQSESVLVESFSSNGLSFDVTYDYTGPSLSLGSFFLSADSANNDGAVATFDMSAGTLGTTAENIGGYLFAASYGRAVVNQSGGTDSTGVLNVPYQQYTSGSSSGQYNLSGNAVLDVNGDENIGSAGFGTFVQSGGTHDVVGSEEIGTYSGTYLLEDGTFTSYRDFIANGSFVQSGGVHDTGTLQIGKVVQENGETFAVGGAATFNGGSTNVSDHVVLGTLSYLGNGDRYLSGPGSITINHGGQLTTPLLDVAANSFVTLNGGTLGIGSIALASDTVGSADFSWNSGTLEVLGNTTLDGSGTGMGAFFGSSSIATANKTLMISGDGTLGGGSNFFMTLNSTGAFVVNGALTINHFSKITLSGGTLAANSINLGGTNTDLVWNSGTLDITGSLALVTNSGSTTTGSYFGTSYTLTGNRALIAGSETIGNKNSPSGYLLETSSGTNSIAGNLAVGPHGAMQIDGATVSANFTNVGGGVLLFSSGKFSPGSMNVIGGGVATFSVANQTFVLNTLSAEGGRFDVGQNNFLIHSGDLNTLRQQIQLGYNNGAWNGSIDLISAPAAAAGGATALGYLLNDDGHGNSLFTTFHGQPATNTDILMAYTATGDANLDGSVDSSDFALLAANYGKVGAFWHDGDFNYDGTVNALDFNALATNYGHFQSGAIAENAIPMGAVVPEPGVCWMIIASALSLLRGRIPARRPGRR